MFKIKAKAEGGKMTSANSKFKDGKNVVTRRRSNPSSPTTIRTRTVTSTTPTAFHTRAAGPRNLPS